MLKNMQQTTGNDAEGGPLLCFDLRDARGWRGAEGGSDYDNLCLELDARSGFSADILPLGGGTGVVWEMQGAGTADVFSRADGSIVILRAWLVESSIEEVARLAAAAPVSRKDFGNLEVPSGFIVMLWAPESSEGAPDAIEDEWVAVEGTAIDESVFIVQASYGHYLCSDEEVRVGESHGRRLTLSPSPK